METETAVSEAAESFNHIDWSTWSFADCARHAATEVYKRLGNPMTPEQLAELSRQAMRQAGVLLG